MDFTINQHMSNLTSVLAYYAYVILAMDYDSFSLKGGQPWWQKAQTIVANAQNTVEKGWKSSESTKNRYWLVENMLQPLFEPMRTCIYKYHRLGFDVMYADVAEGRAAVLEALQGLEAIHNQRPLSFPLQIFFNAKSDEIVKLFSGGLQEEREDARGIARNLEQDSSLSIFEVERDETVAPLEAAVLHW